MEKAIKVPIGTKTYSLTSDDDYLDSISDGFEPDMVRLFQCLLQKQFCALDVGANIGCTSILFGELATSVVSFEPSPTTFRFLTRNIEKSGLSNIRLHNYGLGAQSGESLLTYATNNRSGAFVSGLMKTSVGHSTESIRIRTLDEVERELNLPGIDFIKIDVEGFEKSVIAGGREVIDRFKPIVVLELNHWCLNVFQRICVPDFLDYLRPYSPFCWPLTELRSSTCTTRAKTTSSCTTISIISSIGICWPRFTLTSSTTSIADTCIPRSGCRT